MSAKTKTTGTPSRPASPAKEKAIGTPKKATKTEATEDTNVVPIETKETERYEWGGKYAECTECHETTRKHYSGGQCTRCYTEKRNAKLGLGKYNPETNARRLERLTAKEEKLVAQLSELRVQMRELSKKSA